MILPPSNTGPLEGAWLESLWTPAAGRSRDPTGMWSEPNEHTVKITALRTIETSLSFSKASVLKLLCTASDHLNRANRLNRLNSLNSLNTNSFIDEKFEQLSEIQLLFITIFVHNLKPSVLGRVGCYSASVPSMPVEIFANLPLLELIT